MTARKTLPTDPGADELARALGLALRATRTAAGIGLRECARLSGLAVNTVRALERGEPSASLRVLHAVALAVGTTLPKLLQRATRPPRRTRRPRAALETAATPEASQDDRTEPAAAERSQDVPNARPKDARGLALRLLRSGGLSGSSDHLG